MNHTPGPWRAEPDGDTGGYAILSEEYEVATVTPGDDDSESIGCAKADGYLLAASPHLLAACQQILHWYDVDSTELNREIAIAAVRKAIAAADGRS